MAEIIPIKTRLAERVVDIERALPDAAERAQAVTDADAFFEVMLPAGETDVLWTQEEMWLFAEAFVEQSGPEGGETRFRNMLRVLALVSEPKRVWWE